MPTKPVTTYTFATDGLFGSGPASGFATKIIPGSLAQGFIPGNGINAEWVNYLFGLTGTWITDWISLGSSSAGLDAHLIETNASGSTSVAALTLGGTASTDPPLSVLDNSGYAAAAFTLTTTSAAGFGILAAATSTGATIRALNSGSGFAFQGLNVGGGGGGGSFSGNGSGPGVSADGGSSGSGVEATGSGVGHGVDARALGTGSGLFAERQITGGPCARFESTGGGSPTRGILYLEPQIEPSAAIDGDLWKITGVSGFGRGGLEWYDDDGKSGGSGPGKQRAWSSTNGLGRQAVSVAGDTTESATVLTTKATLSLGSAASPGDPLGVWDVFFKASVRLAAGAALTTRAIVEFWGPGGLIESHTETFDSLGDKKIVMTSIPITLAAGIQSYTIRFRTNSAGNGVTISEARIHAIGAH